MKLIYPFLIVAICAVSLQLDAQNNAQASSLSIDDVEFKYGELIGHRDAFGNVSMQIDTGQLMNVERLEGQRQKYGRTKIFLYQSFAAAMNDLSPSGWHLVQVYNWPYRETLNEIRWVIRRRIEQ